MELAENLQTSTKYSSGYSELLLSALAAFILVYLHCFLHTAMHTLESSLHYYLTLHHYHQHVLLIPWLLSLAFSPCPYNPSTSYPFCIWLACIEQQVISVWNTTSLDPPALLAFEHGYIPDANDISPSASRNTMDTMTCWAPHTDVLLPRKMQRAQSNKSNSLLIVSPLRWGSARMTLFSLEWSSWASIHYIPPGDSWSHRRNKIKKTQSAFCDLKPT